MRFVEFDLLGVYVAPMSLMLVGAWVVTLTLRLIAARYGVLRHVWHPALFVFSVYVIVLSTIILIFARRTGMSEAQLKSQPETGGADGAEPRPAQRLARTVPGRRPRVLAVLLTVLAAVIARVLGRAMWNAYMGAPWTRDATVRDYVVAMAPEVAGQTDDDTAAPAQRPSHRDALRPTSPSIRRSAPPPTRARP